jgi:uncharacterized membrane protein
MTGWLIATLLVAPLAAGIAAGIALDAWHNLRQMKGQR